MSASARGGAHPRTRRAFALKRSERWNRFSASHVLGTSLSDVKICKMQVRNGNVLHQNTVAGIDCNQGVVSGRRRGSEGGGGIRKNAVPELQYIATRREIGDDVLAGACTEDERVVPRAARHPIRQTLIFAGNIFPDSHRNVSQCDEMPRTIHIQPK